MGNGNINSISVNSSNFYCKIIAGDPDFSIEEYDKKFKECIRLALSENETAKVLGDNKGKCKKQCFDCMAIVGKRRLETKKLMS